MRARRRTPFGRALPAAVLILVSPAMGSSGPAGASPPGDLDIRRAAETEKQDAFLPVEYDRATGRVLLEVTRPGEELLYMNTLATGLGSNRVRLDRGQIGREAVVRFERHGPRVLLIQRNLGFRAVAGDDALRRSVAESFPESVLASFAIEREERGRLVVDATDFFLSDVFDVRGRVRDAGLGELRLDESASHIQAAHTASFPTNTEVRSVLTYRTDAPSAELRRLAPDGRAITLQQHHSFVELPGPGFAPRRFDPRAGLFGTGFFDFARGFDDDYRGGYVARWRLEPSDPAAYARGEPVEPVRPIVYYLDPAVPEPYRTAFIEGGLWWNEIFEAAGFRDAFRIEELPAGADPMDARYSVIQWVHRNEPGPSVGPSFRDPRTGEIIKTTIRMDSHRSLVNYNIYAGLLPAAGAAGLEPDAEEFAMARRRQHSAHEIGHTLGIAHNFIAASQGRASVMDYPAPLIRLDEQGRLDLSQAYRPGGGAHDTLAIRYAYTWYETPEQEARGLDAIVRGALADGLRFITGFHAASSGSHPNATQWVEGDDMLDALERTTAVRRLLVDRFDERAVRPGEPFSVLNQRFAHVYLHHRYALEGAVKMVGGMEFSYALRGDGQAPTRVVPAAEQRSALERVLAALEPSELAVPPRVAALIPPPPFGSDGSERWIASPAGPAFDPLSLAAALAHEITANLLHPERAARLVAFHAADPAYPTLDYVLERLIEATWGARGGPAAGAAYRRAAQRAALDGLLDLAGDVRSTHEVRATAEQRLAELGDRLARAAAADRAESAHRAAAARDIRNHFEGKDDRDRRWQPQPVQLPWP